MQRLEDSMAIMPQQGNWHYHDSYHNSTEMTLVPTRGNNGNDATSASSASCHGTSGYSIKVMHVQSGGYYNGDYNVVTPLAFCGNRYHYSTETMPVQDGGYDGVDAVAKPAFYLFK